MAAKLNSIDFAGLQNEIAAQFRGLDKSNPSSWPTLPRTLICLAVAAVSFALVWYALVSNQIDDLEKHRQQEATLKAQYTEKYAKVVNMEPLRKQRQQVEQYVAQLEKQLPGKAEMYALLSDINQAGVGRNLQFETFKPSKEEVKNYYAVLPVAIKVSGHFPDIAGFASDVAHLSRIVTLNNISIDPAGGSPNAAKDATSLQMQATANTYRYLDKSEIPAQKASGSKPGSKP